MSEIVLVSPPDISSAQLLFDEGETRQILKFFWPHLSERINGMEITDERRHFAQKILIVAIDSTYALGFMKQLTLNLFMPQAGFKGLVTMGRKLASSYIKHWWKHAKQDDLRNPLVAEAVRKTVANNFAGAIGEIIENASARPRLSPFYMVTTMTSFWGGA